VKAISLQRQFGFVMKMNKTSDEFDFPPQIVIAAGVMLFVLLAVVAVG
jgi:hypothetical protein